MLDRGFGEIELREMLDAAITWQPDHVPGRFAIECRYDNMAWHVIVEPDEPTQTLIVVTAYLPDALP